MRTVAAVVLAWAVLSAPPARAEDSEPPLIELNVGDEKVLGGYRPLCDDLTVARFSEDGRGALKALKDGETICSVSVGSPLGRRAVYRVVVVTKVRPGQKKPAPVRR